MAYHSGPEGTNASANDNVRVETVSEEAQRGIAELEIFLAGASAAVESPVLVNA